MRYIVIIGHTYLSQGASYENGWLTEYQYNNMIATDISCILSEKGHECIVVVKDDLTHKDLVELVDYQEPKAIIELHCNAYDEKAGERDAFGTETLFTRNNPRSGELARKLQVCLTKALGRKGKGNRGVKLLSNKKQRGYRNLIDYKAPACIVEPFFIDYKEDVLLGFKEMGKIVNAIVQGSIS